MTEKEKMDNGLWYDANFDKELLEERLKCADLCFEYNQLKPSDSKKKEILNEILGYDVNADILSPVTFDYGYRTSIGHGTFININCYFMDGGTIEIGNNVFIGPSCGFYTANHALDIKARNAGMEIALPIKVGDNCWFGANVSVMPGVTIGSGCVIAAGSVVTKDVADNSLVAGVPAKFIKTIVQS